MAEPAHRHVQTNGIKMHYVEQGTGPLIVLCHGWPESWYSYRHQIPVLAGAGFRVVAPDQRGYGDTGCPQPVEAYSQKQIVADIAGMLDALGIRKCVIVGHDWGGMTAWNAPLMYPDRIERVIGINLVVGDLTGVVEDAEAGCDPLGRRRRLPHRPLPPQTPPATSARPVPRSAGPVLPGPPAARSAPPGTWTRRWATRR